MAGVMNALLLKFIVSLSGAFTQTYRIWKISVIQQVFTVSSSFVGKMCLTLPSDQQFFHWVVTLRVLCILIGISTECISLNTCCMKVWVSPLSACWDMLQHTPTQTMGSFKSGCGHFYTVTTEKCNRIKPILCIYSLFHDSRYCIQNDKLL